jgi:hypothetical protein
MHPRAYKEINCAVPRERAGKNVTIQEIFR